MKKIITIAYSLLLLVPTYAQKTYSISSPDQKLKAEIGIDTQITWRLTYEDRTVIEKSPIDLCLSDGTSLNQDPKVIRHQTSSKDDIILSPIYKRSQIRDCFNQLEIKFKKGFTLVCRMYDEGFAYRIRADRKSPFQIVSETAQFRFPGEPQAYIPYVQVLREPLDAQFYGSFENTYQHIPLSQFDKRRLAFLPLVVQPDGLSVCITEADLKGYPGMYLYNADNSSTLKGVFAPYPKEIKQGGHNMLQGEVQSRYDYLARCNNTFESPWRVVSVVDQEKKLLDSDLVYKLAEANRIGDISWIKPGKVAWDWWNDWNLYGVDFEAGINNQTYQYYIDFAAANHIEYVILDEGWAVNKKADLMQVVPEIDLPKLVAYASSKGVGLILWAGYYAFNRDMEAVCKHYSQMGIKGFKVDFMDRDDQPMTDFHYRAAETAAKYKLMIDFHGTYKPTGLQRTFPNVINFEGIHGLEQLKWRPETPHPQSVNPNNSDMVTYDVTFPFIRMVAGPVDYTQGAMRNAAKGNYRPVNNEAMSQGTRCRQLAEYVIFESPLNMLCDSPSNYMREQECTDFITAVPTVWDNTIALDGKIGEYIVMARNKGDVWYVGGLTSWQERQMEIDLSFLGEGKFTAELFRDGVNAHRAGRDYKKETLEIPASKKLTVKMAPGGGFAMRITQN